MTPRHHKRNYLAPLTHCFQLLVLMMFYRRSKPTPNPCSGCHHLNDTSATMKLTLKNLHPTATSLLHVLSMLDGTSIPEDMLIRWRLLATAGNYPFGRDEYLIACAALVAAEMVTRDEKAGVLRVESGVQEVVRSGLDREEFRGAFNTAAVLLAAVWPVGGEEGEGNGGMEKIRVYLPHVRKLRLVLEERGVEEIKPVLVTASLFNEASWAYQLFQTGSRLEIADEYAALAEEVAEASEEDDDYNEQFRSKILCDAYRFQGTIGGCLGNNKGLLYARKWIETLGERRAKSWQEKGDEMALPMAYNEYGRALMWVSEKEEALRYWGLAREKILRNTGKGQLPFPFPWINSALVHAYDGNTALAESLIIPILEKRESVLGKDDAETFETGLVLICAGNVRRAQGRRDEAYALFQRAFSIVPVATGKRSLWSTQAYYRLAAEEYYQGRYAEARDLLIEMVAFIDTGPWLEVIAARGNWKLAKTLMKLGDPNGAPEAQEMIEQSMGVWRNLNPGDNRTAERLKDEDWDQSVFYLYR
ncbi:hypothetical protein B0T16DRAFT_457140 [Cercophora newfieldiana]|uniref:DUF7779 domain-containing protein n=1 Tax=Cercophora newfieldiana TaxID=92897 RepID=A0AA40CUP4_9PEZI|nr:hypothetical protein B0T16DRAFT_457140 [Cercophora newfieldiana]